MDAPVALRIVVVEDSLPVRERVVRALQGCGAVQCIGEAGGVASAIEQIDRLDPDALVLDLHLPDGTGLDVLRAVRPGHQRLRIAVLTSFASDQYRAACIVAGADHVFDKITEFDALLETVRGWAARTACADERHARSGTRR